MVVEYQNVTLENIHISNIVQTEKFVHMHLHMNILCVCACVCVCVCVCVFVCVWVHNKVNVKRDNEFDK